VLYHPHGPSAKSQHAEAEILTVGDAQSETRKHRQRRLAVPFRVEMSALRFNVVYEDAGDGWVYAHVPELPEVHTQG
jgi:hypothetical protein